MPPSEPPPSEPPASEVPQGGASSSEPPAAASPRAGSRPPLAALAVAPPPTSAPPADLMTLSLPPEALEAVEDDLEPLDDADDPLDDSMDGFEGSVDVLPDESTDQSVDDLLELAAPLVDPDEPAQRPIEEASAPPPAAAAVEGLADALGSEAPGQVLSTDELEQLQLGKMSPPPVPQLTRRLVLRVMNHDVGDDAVVELGDTPVTIGSGDVDLSLDDPWLSPRHARVRQDGPGASVEDLDSLNGVWVRARGPVHLKAGDRFMVGEQVCEIAAADTERAAREVAGVRRLGGTPSDSPFVLRVLGCDGLPTQMVGLKTTGLRLGRHLGELVFTDDTHLSATHAVVRVEGDAVRVDDLGSRNGTWEKLHGPRALEPGDTFMTGRTVWRLGTALR